MLMQNYTYVEPTMDPLWLFVGLILSVLVVIGLFMYFTLRSTESTPKKAPRPRSPEPFVPSYYEMESTHESVPERELVAAGGSAEPASDRGGPSDVRSEQTEASTYTANTKGDAHILHMN